MTNISFIDETFDINQTSSYKLSIQCNLNGLSFCVYDEIAQKYIAIGSYSINEENNSIQEIINLFEHVFKKEQWLLKEFKAVKCIYVNHKNTLVPKEIFKEEKLKAFFEYNFELDEFDELNYNLITFINSFVVTSIHSDLTHYLRGKYKNITFTNQNEIFLNDASNYCHNKIGNIVFINYENQLIDFAVFNKSNLVLQNSTERKDPVSNLYVLLNIFENLKLNTQFTEVLLSGDISNDDEEFKLLEQYLGKLKYRTKNRNKAFSYQFKKVPEHQFLNLINSFDENN